MDLVGEFHKVDIDGKPYLVYRNVMRPSPQIHSPNSSDEKTTIQKPLSILNQKSTSAKVAIDSGDDLSLPPHFICPTSRIRSTVRVLNTKAVDYIGAEDYLLLYRSTIPPFLDDIKHDHHVLPLFWCNNQEASPEEVCHACSIKNFNTGYYFCVECDKMYHRECVECALEINYPSHIKHSIQLHFSQNSFDHCILCRKKTNTLVYHCLTCEIFMHVHCAQATIPFFIEQPKMHDHTLTLFPREYSLTCNICGLINTDHLPYVCRSICSFVAHRDCIYIPQTIKNSRHHHRLSFIPYLPFGNWSCGVCRQEVDNNYGAYTCSACSGYVVHTRCALRIDIWDDIDLEGVPEEDEDVEPFEKIADGIILHIFHGCHLKFEASGVYGEEMFCQACILPINKGNFYVCVECDFFLHEACADAPKKKVHPLHPHPLSQKAYDIEGFCCSACKRQSNGFGYECTKEDCKYILDVVCASVSEPFNYQGHQHPLFLALDPKEKPVCHICKSAGIKKVLNCVECDFIICFECATLPYMVRYKHDEHYLTFCRGDAVSESDWCELCEGKLATRGKKGFYNCNYCCTTLHIDCLLGPHFYFNPALRMPTAYGEIIFHRNNSPSRPICFLCNTRCPFPFYVEVIDGIFSVFYCTFDSSCNLSNLVA